MSTQKHIIKGRKPLFQVTCTGDHPDGDRTRIIGPHGGVCPVCRTFNRPKGNAVQVFLEPHPRKPKRK